MIKSLLLSGNIRYFWYFLVLVGCTPAVVIIMVGWWFYVRKASSADAKIGRFSLGLLLAFMVGVGTCFSTVASLR
jgi:hypothetical protein